MVQVTITDIGAQGDGIATIDDKIIYVDGVMQGEVVDIEISQTDPNRATLNAIITPSHHRVKPPCSHAKICGGCQFQHWPMDIYQSWKQDTVYDYLRANGLNPTQIDAPIFIPQATRRRANFSWRRDRTTLTCGYHRRRSHDLFDVKNCLILHPDLDQLRRDFITMMTPNTIKGQKGDVFIQMTDNGFDVMWYGPMTTDKHGKLSPDAMQDIATFCQTHHIIRLGWQIDSKSGVDIIYNELPPMVNFGPLNVAISPNGFLQPSKQSQDALAMRMIDYMGDSSKTTPIADLFCGHGTFTGYLLAQGYHHIDAYEGDKTAISALKSAGHQRAVARDLFRDPLTATDLNTYQTIVIDPPRAGAKAQCDQLAQSDVVDTIIYISCNPASLTRDAKILLDGGYRLERLTLVDQFIWSAHSELVTLFKK